MNGFIFIDGGALRVSGTPPFRCFFTPLVAKVLLTLPPIGEEYDSPGTVAYLLKHLDASSKKSFDAVLAADPTVKSMHSFLIDNYAEIAFESGEWPAILDNRQVLEELMVDSKPVKLLLCTLTGQRFVCPTLSDGYVDRMTFNEFRYRFGRTVGEHLNTMIKPRIERLQRAVLIANIDEPEPEVEIPVANQTGLDRLRVRQFLPDQIEDYLRRHSLVNLVDTNAVKEP